jgi:hypothetical protein
MIRRKLALISLIIAGVYGLCEARRGASAEDVEMIQQQDEENARVQNEDIQQRMQQFENERLQREYEAFRRQLEQELREMNEGEGIPGHTAPAA